jgi:hypothetical protein
MVLFSQRNGLVPEKILQDKDFNLTSRRLLAHKVEKFSYYMRNHDLLGQLEEISEKWITYGIEANLWADSDSGRRKLFFETVILFNTIELRFSSQSCRTFFESLRWDQILDLLEIIIESVNHNREIVKFLNNAFEEIGWAYKVTKDGQIISIMDDISFESLEGTLSLTGKWEGVKTYVAKAVSLYKHRKYTEACMGMSDALDNMSKVIDGKESSYFSKMVAGQVKYDNKNPLAEGSPDWMKKLPTQPQGQANVIYALRNDYFGHGNGIKNEVEASFAKWYLVSCSALINWMIEKYA